MLNLTKQERYRARYARMTPGYRPALDVYTAWLAAHVTDATRLLDAGCGPGGLVRDYEGVARLVVGADEYADRFDEPAEIRLLVTAAMDVLPFASGSVDVVTCSWVLEHLRQPQRAFAEIARVLKPGGHLLFITPNTLNYVVWLRRLIPNAISKPIVHKIYGRAEDFINPTYYRANTARQIDRLLRDAGLMQVRLEAVSDPTYLALNDALFFVSVGIERVMGRIWPGSGVHLVGLYRS